MQKKFVVDVPEDLDIATLGSNFALVVKKSEKGYAIDKTVNEKNISRLTLKPAEEPKGPSPYARDYAAAIMEGFTTYEKAHPPAEKPA